MTKDVTRYELISSHGFDHPSDEMVKDPAGSWVTYEYCESLKEQIERLTRERDLPRAAIEQLHAAVKAAQELAATRLMEIGRLQKRDEQLMEFLRAFISGGVNQDFKPWGRELYQRLYRDSAESVPTCQVAGCGKPCLIAEDGAVGGLCAEHNGNVIRPRDEGERWNLSAERIAELRRFIDQLLSTHNMYECIAIRDMLSEEITIEPGPSRAGVSVKDPAPPQEIILCAAMGPSGFICERPKGHPGRHCDGDNQCWPAQKSE